MLLHVINPVYFENSGVGNHLVDYVNENRLDRELIFFWSNARHLHAGR